MFDKIVAVVPPGRQTHNHHVTVNMPETTPEKAAELLDGLRKEAATYVKNAVLVDVPGIDCKVVTYDLCRNDWELAYEHRVAFTLNGKPYDLALRHSEDRHGGKNVAEEVCLAIARAIMGQAIPTAYVAWRNLSSR